MTKPPFDPEKKRSVCDKMGFHNPVQDSSKGGWFCLICRIWVTKERKYGSNEPRYVTQQSSHSWDDVTDDQKI